MTAPDANTQDSGATDPAVAYEFRKSHLEVVRATLQVFQGRPMIDLRVWVPRSRDKQLTRTPKGLTLDRAQLPELERAIRALRIAAEAVGR